MSTIGLRPTHTDDDEPSGAYEAVAAPQRTSPQAATVFGLGVVSLTVGWGIAAILALTMARAAQREIDESEGQLGGDNLIRTGKLCAWISIAVTVLVLLFVLPMFFNFMASMDEGPGFGNAPSYWTPGEFEATYGTR